MGIFNFLKKEKRTALTDQLLDYVYSDTVGSIYGSQALTLPTVLASVKMLAEDTSLLPLKVYKKKTDGGREEQANHPLSELLQLRANSRMSAMSMRQAIITNLLLTGNAYIYKRVDRLGRVYDLTPIKTSRVYRSVSLDGSVNYTIDGKPIADGDIIHIKLFSETGEEGISLISKMSRALKTLDESENYSYNLLKNGARPGVIIKHQTNLPNSYQFTKEKAELFKDSWDNAYRGGAKTGKTAIVPPHLDVQELTMPRNDLQMIETRKFQKREWAMVTRIPLHKLAEVEGSNYSSNTEGNREYVKGALVPLLEAIEQEMNWALLSKQERQQGLYIEHNIDGLLRGDLTSRIAYYTAMLDRGVISRNEVRDLENLNPIAGGNEYVPMLNSTAKIDGGAKSNETKSHNINLETRAKVESKTAQRRQIANEHREKIKNLISKTYKEIKSQLKNKTREEVENYLNTDIRKLDVKAKAEKVFVPLARSIAEATKQEIKKDIDIKTQVEDFGKKYAERFSARVLSKNETALRNAYNDDTLDDYLNALEDETRIETETKTEITQSRNAMYKTALVFLGVTKIMSVASGSEDCPFCRALDGAVIGIEKNFVDKGGTIEGDNGEIMTSNVNRGHPPYHDGCDCDIVAITE